MKRRDVWIVFVLSFVFTAALLAATIRDKQLLKQERKSLILQNDSLHILQLESKQELMKMSKLLDSIKNRASLQFKN